MALADRAMRRITCVLITIGLALHGCDRIGPAAPPDVFRHSLTSVATPWTHERFDDDTDKFTFAIFSDLNGGQRAGIFETAIAQINLLRPELILSVGDLIDGGSEDRDKLARDWNEFDSDVSRAIAPVFYVGGNHDLTNLTMSAVWEERYGARYYHFAYKNVLFVVLDTEDNPPERMREIYRARAAAIEILDGRAPGKWEETEYFNMPERTFGKIGEDQVNYVRKALAEYNDVRWTFLLMHKPAWRQADDTGFARIETALADRPYTVINGHFHTYSHETRHGRDYISLGTTGGSQNAQSDAAFDHVTLVTMSAGGPTISNLRLDGILDQTGHIPLDGDVRCYQASKCGIAE